MNIRPNRESVTFEDPAPHDAWQGDCSCLRRGASHDLRLEAPSADSSPCRPSVQKTWHMWPRSVTPDGSRNAFKPGYPMIRPFAMRSPVLHFRLDFIQMRFRFRYRRFLTSQKMLLKIVLKLGF